MAQWKAKVANSWTRSLTSVEMSSLVAAPIPATNLERPDEPCMPWRGLAGRSRLTPSLSAVDCQRAYGPIQRSPCRSRLHDADCLRSHRQEQPSLKNYFIGSGLNGLRVLSQLTTVF